jgi:hypothetical protein
VQEAVLSKAQQLQEESGLVEVGRMVAANFQAVGTYMAGPAAVPAVAIRRPVLC